MSLSRVAVGVGFDASRDDRRRGDGIHSREGVGEVWKEGRRRGCGGGKPQPGEARKLAKEIGAAAFTNFEKVLADDSIEAVDVTVPSGHHRKYVVAALDGGKHVFCETPMALTLREADAMIAAAKAHRRLLLVAQVMRFVPAYQHAHEEAASGHLGKPRVVVARRLSRPYWTAKHRRPFSEYGEPLIELSIHDFDVANWILGHPVSVVASGMPGRTGATEHAFVSIQYRGGNALVEGSAMMPPGFPFTTAVRVQGENGVLDHTDQFIRGPVPVTRFVRYSPEGIQPVRVRGQDPYEEECRHFVRCVQGRADATALSVAAERDAPSNRSCGQGEHSNG